MIQSTFRDKSEIVSFESQVKNKEFHIVQIQGAPF